jgi:hypothetical protein
MTNGKKIRIDEGNPPKPSPIQTSKVRPENRSIFGTATSAPSGQQGPGNASTGKKNDW